jgi:type IV pilus assembly protein PilO
MELSLNKLPWYGQVGLFVVLALAMVGTFYYFYVMPAQADMVGRRQQLATLRADITKGSTVANQLNQFKSQVAELEARLESLKAVLPEQKDVADLLRRIQTLAVQSNLAIRGFKPAASVTKQMHAEWPIALQLDGTYHNLGMFFDRVSKFSRIINISNLDIKAKTQPLPNSTITAECVATTFVLLEQKAAAPARGAGPAPGTGPAQGTAPPPPAKSN